MRPLTFDEKCERFPPVLVRLLARSVLEKNRSPMAWTDAKIAERSGLNINRVRVLSKFTNWESIDAPTRRAFLKGCGADFDSRRWLQRNTQYIVTIQSIPRFLRKSREWKTTFEPLVQLWWASEQAKAA